MKYRCLLLFAMLALLNIKVLAQESEHVGPEAGARTYAQNYKDMVLASCLADAYQDNSAGSDIGSSASALRDWTYFDMEESTIPRINLVRKYLSRDYTNPLVESEIKGIKFDFLKCLDLYHSPELQGQVEKYVVDPDHTYRKDFIKK